MWNTWGIGEVHTGFLWGNLKEMDHFKNLGIHSMQILKWVLNRSAVRV
jgi:hypothetical protein